MRRFDLGQKILRKSTGKAKIIDIEMLRLRPISTRLMRFLGLNIMKFRQFYDGKGFRKVILLEILFF